MPLLVLLFYAVEHQSPFPVVLPLKVGYFFCVSLILPFKLPEREIKFVRPLYSVEVTETETAKFETEISESDIHATWKLKGEALHPSAVRLTNSPFVSGRKESSPNCFPEFVVKNRHLLTGCRD